MPATQKGQRAPESGAVRQPIVAVLGHVDSGKTSLLDRIRGTGVQGREAGGITQHIGASFLPIEVIRKMCGPALYGRLESQTGSPIPGILVIDTPGHEVFTNLRSRGGSAADIAVLVVDANRGFQPQTTESLKILGERKVPFVVALNKCDQISGWRQTESPYISQALKEQDPSVQTDLDQKVYDVVGTLSVRGYKAEAFSRVRDFKSEVAIVPISARSGVGIPELLGVLVGLTQQYLQKKLGVSGKETRGMILEVNDEVGLGPSANVILIDGSMGKDDIIVAARRDSVAVARPKAILLPKALDEMRDPRDKFTPVSRVDAAAGLKITSPELDGVLPGSTLYVASGDSAESDAERYAEMIKSEMESVFVDDTQTASGVILRCDTIGSLEATVSMLRDAGVAVSKADIGPVNRRDIVQAKAIKEKDRHLGVILAFNVRVLPDAREEADTAHIRIFEDKVIYSMIDSYSAWVTEDTADQDNAVFSETTPVARFTFLKDMAFRNSNPAVFGIRVDVGTLRQKAPFMNESARRIGTIHQLQLDKKTVPAASAGQEVACSVNDVAIGRQVTEGSTYYTAPSSREAKELQNRFWGRLSPEEQQVLEEIVRIQREKDPAYAY